MSIVQLAVFEAVNTITGDYERYLAAPIGAPGGASAEAAAIAAAHRTLKNYFPTNTAIDTDRVSALAAIPNSQAKTDGIAVGEAAAAALIALRAADGSAPATFFLPSSGVPGAWQTTPSCPAAGGQFYQWKDVTPFGIASPSDFLHNLWRPETAIRAAEAGSTFVPFITTPCFPSYPSNHASGTNGGLEMMRRLFGAAGHDITFTNNVPALGGLAAKSITRNYTQLKQISDDVDNARVYSGIHFRFDQDRGNDLGRAVATEIHKNHLRPVHGRE